MFEYLIAVRWRFTWHPQCGATFGRTWAWIFERQAAFQQTGLLFITLTPNIIVPKYFTLSTGFLLLVISVSRCLSRRAAKTRLCHKNRRHPRKMLFGRRSRLAYQHSLSHYAVRSLLIERRHFFLFLNPTSCVFLMTEGRGTWGECCCLSMNKEQATDTLLRYTVIFISASSPQIQFSVSGLLNKVLSPLHTYTHTRFTR